MSAPIALSRNEWNYVVGVLTMRGEKGARIATSLAERIQAQLESAEVVQTIAVNESDDVPVDLQAALVAAYDREHTTLTDDPARREAIGIAAWEWLATGNNPLVDVTRDTAESDG